MLLAHCETVTGVESVGATKHRRGRTQWQETVDRPQAPSRSQLGKMAGLEDEFVGGEAERSRSWREAWDVVRGSWGRPGLLATGDSFRLLEDRAPRATTRSERARARARCGEKEGSEERGVFERGDVQEKKQ